MIFSVLSVDALSIAIRPKFEWFCAKIESTDSGKYLHLLNKKKPDGANCA